MKKQTIKFLCFLMIIVLVLSSCGEKEKLLHIQFDLTSAPKVIDPQYATNSSTLTVVENLFSGLVRVSNSGEIVPDSAESWDISTDGLTYTFKLRDNLEWSNGDPVTAEDFVFGIKRLFNDIAPSPLAENYRMIKNANEILAGNISYSQLGVTALSNSTLQIVLENRDPSILTMLSLSGAMPCKQSFFEEQKGKYGLTSENILTNGPFKIRTWQVSYLQIIANQKFYSPTQVDAVTLYFNRENPLSQFTNGQNDAVAVPYEEQSKIDVSQGEVFVDKSWLLLFNTRNDAFKQEDIRISLASVLDINALLEQLPANLTPYDGVLSPNVNILGEQYRSIVGMPKKAVFINQPRERFLLALEELKLDNVGKATLLVTEFEPGNSFGGSALRAWQQELSTFINMEQVSYSELLTRVAKKDFDIALAPIDITASSPIEILSYFKDIVDEKNTNEALSTLLEQARTQSTQEQLGATLLKAEQLLIDNFIAIPLFSSNIVFLTNPNISNIEYSPTKGTVYFAKATMN